MFLQNVKKMLDSFMSIIKSLYDNKYNTLSNKALSNNKLSQSDIIDNNNIIEDVIIITDKMKYDISEGLLQKKLTYIVVQNCILVKILKYFKQSNVSQCSVVLSIMIKKLGIDPVCVVHGLNLFLSKLEKGIIKVEESQRTEMFFVLIIVSWLSYKTNYDNAFSIKYLVDFINIDMCNLDCIYISSDDVYFGTMTCRKMAKLEYLMLIMMDFDFLLDLDELYLDVYNIYTSIDENINS